jgi:hypothetical protein
MKNRRRQADEFEAAPFGESDLLGPEMEAEMGLDNAPKMLGEVKGMPPTLDPFWQVRNINKVSNREEAESLKGREARLARRLLVILRQQG